MALLHLSETKVGTVKGLRPFALGFRPFFLLAGLGAVGLMLAWISLWHLPFPPEIYYNRVGWHSHEMLFGFTLAVMAGFLLTAVPNWTGQPTPTGSALALLAAVWVAGRLLPWLPGAPAFLIAMVDLAFLPLLALALLRPIWVGKNKVNRVFILLLAAMFLANILVHGEALGWLTGSAQRGIVLMLDLVLLTLLLVSGRVVPFFTEMAISGAISRRRPWVEWTGFALLVVLALLHLVGASGWRIGLPALILGAVQAVRLIGWHDRRVWRIPILWVLYTGYGWLVVGFLALGLGALEKFPPTLGIHALTGGAIGVFTLGMMVRVSLGHTGRAMRSTPAVNVAFVVANLAVAVRVFGPFFMPSWYVAWILLSGILWVLAFGIFTAIYAPYLVRARVDGREG